MPFFSIIIPLYNKERFIENTIKSIINQSFKDFEIIIVDDGSTDKSYEIASAFQSEKIKLLKQDNKGVSVARNVGIDYAASKYIALLDADDTWYDNHLFELKKQIDLFPGVGLYCNNYKVFYNKNFGEKAQFNFTYKEDCLIVEDYFKASIINSVAWTSASAFSKEKFNLIGKFNTTLRTAQDLDLWIRFALLFKVGFNPTITMAYKIYVDNSLSKNEYNNIRYEFISSYTKEEQFNPSLKMYLDVNRYALAIRCKLNNELGLHKKLEKEIDYKNLNVKQKLLIRFPKFLLQLIKTFQKKLILNNIYVTAYK